MIDWLYGLQGLGVKLGLDSIRRLLVELGHPETAFPSILIGGTNGKGSVGSMLHALLGASGVKAGLFTSPHLVRPNERIRIGPLDIGDEELERQLGRVRATIETGMQQGALEVHPSFFEVITATALQSFRDHGVRAGLLEVGLGGRLDATNAVDAELAVIVGVDLDHTKTLGETVEQIALEKAGIVKPGKPVISGVVRQEAISVLQRVCRERGAPLIDAGTAMRLVGEDGDTIVLESKRQRYDGIRLSLGGRHQIHNARVALAAFEQFADHLDLQVDPDTVRAGLGAVRWPGRLQWVRGGATGCDLLLDGAHNPAGVATLAKFLEGLSGPPPVALFGAMDGKLLDAMVGEIAPRVGTFVITRPDVKRAADPREIAAVVGKQAETVEVVEDPARALDRARALAGSERFVVVTGSLYLIGEILGLLEQQPVRGPVSM